ncbi:MULTISPECIES: hypothetical protein [Ramlibacter]|uniref:Uncharacterized protein n=1 Tax=Ramlibacter pinisoli TaxID=2682844 RepID=A0A6N8IMG7_9BURK|nr:MULTISPECIES: hypothetical protein [Ramlibacter]MBA2960691.1 hypothetical protein [Ramlibacter sp. CGMCC 1.13660]MVQ28021.1 hypothetical protein [Ramlibacter pinisoli]
MPYLAHPLLAACRRPCAAIGRLLPAVAAALLAGAALAPAAALADDLLVRFDGGIGSQPLRSGPAVNTVQNVNPGGIPWVIAELRADVRTDGRIRVNGRGLLLAGGNGVGTNGNQSVRARLFCDGAASDSNLVALEPNGDFRIDDRLVPTPPTPCNSPILLIVSGGGNWFAAGIPDR